MSLYQASQAKDNCGFGLIAQLDGVQSHQLIETAITALTRMTHRGAIHSDGKTGDGCGLSIQLCKSYFRKTAESLNFTLGEKFAIGQVFLNSDESIATQSRKILEEELLIQNEELIELENLRSTHLTLTQQNQELEEKIATIVSTYESKEQEFAQICVLN